MVFGQYVFEIKPSEGLGFIKLGTTLFQVVNLLRSNGITDLRFVYSDKNINNTPYIIDIINLNIRLTFDPICQKLILIEVNNWKSCKFIYHRELVNGNSTKIPNFKSIYNKFFGLTYPGEFKEELNLYFLSYPGICFNFELPVQLAKKMSLRKENPNDLIPIMDNYTASNINCTSFMIFKGDSRVSALDSLKSILRLDGIDYFTLLRQRDHGAENVESLAEDNVEKVKEAKNAYDLLRSFQNYELESLIIEYCEFSVVLGIINIFFAKHPKNLKYFTIKIGITTMQDIIRVLGPPDESLNKLMNSKIMIHNKRKNSNGGSGSLSGKGIGGNYSDDNTIVKIHNYMRFGLDMVYDIGNNGYEDEEEVNKTGVDDKDAQGNNEKEDDNDGDNDGDDVGDGDDDDDDDDDDDEMGSPAVSKIIFHNNIVNSLEFMKYERVLFNFELQSAIDVDKQMLKSIDINKSSDVFRVNGFSSGTLSKVCNTSSEHKDFEFPSSNKPMFLNRRDYELSIDSNYSLIPGSYGTNADFTTYETFNPTMGINISNQGSCNNFEVIEIDNELDSGSGSGSGLNSSVSSSGTGSPVAGNINAKDSSTTLDDHSNEGSAESGHTSRVETWGLSKLQSEGRCIFEIMIDNHSISSVTLF